MDGYLAEDFHSGENECLSVSRKTGAGVFQEKRKDGVFQERLCEKLSRQGMLDCFMIGS